ncbi:MAG: hypothetical protein AB7V19_08265, partial [Candidatus Bipolaricaulia bacterium]
WGARAALGLALAGIAWMSLRPVADAPLDRWVRGAGNGYLHVPAYALLTGLFVLVLGPTRRRIVVAGLAATAYGWALELAQWAAPTRHFNLLGLGLDAAGAAGMCLLALLVVGARAARRSGREKPDPRSSSTTTPERAGRRSGASSPTRRDST